MNKQLTLEARIARLEQILSQIDNNRTNELFGFGKKLNSTDGEAFANLINDDNEISSAVKAKQPSYRSKQNEFYVTITYKNPRRYKGWFLVSGNGKPGKMYCAYYTKSSGDPELSIKNLDPQADYEDIQQFIIKVSNSIARVR